MALRRRRALTARQALLRGRDFETLPMPSSPGPTWAPSTAPISETKAGSQPKISRPSSTSPSAVSTSWMCWTTQASKPVLVALAGVVAQPLDRAGAGPDPLDRGDLLLEGEDRLDLQRRADPGPGAADPAAAPQVLEGVDREPHLQLLARLLGAGEDGLAVAPRRRGGGGGEDAEAHPAGGRARVEDVDPLAALAFVDEPVASLARRPRRCRRCRPRCGSRRSRGRRRAAARRRR